MTPTAILNQSVADGVIISLSVAGKVKVAGDQVHVDKWLPTIREFKMSIIAFLSNAVEAEPIVEINRKTGSVLNATFPANLSVDHNDLKRCPDCRHFAQPGKSDGYCGGRNDLPLAYGVNHPLRKLPADRGASCAQWLTNE